MTRLLILLSFFSLSASAEQGLYTLDSLPKKAQKSWLKNATEATFKLTVGPHGNCTGAFISPDGYALTALHCLVYEFKLPEYYLSGLYEALVEPEHERYVLHTYKNFDSIKPKVADSLDAELENGKVYSHPEIVYIGSGFSEFIDEVLFKDLSAEDQKIIADHQQDYAILKYNVDSPVSFVPISNKKTEIGQKVWSIGYPKASERQNGHGSVGGVQKISYGSVVPTFLHTPVFSDTDPKDLSLLVQMFEGQGSFMTDLDLYEGASGGPVFNHKGQIVGINNTTYIAHPARAYQKDSAQHASILSFMSEIKKALKLP